MHCDWRHRGWVLSSSCHLRYASVRHQDRQVPNLAALDRPLVCPHLDGTLMITQLVDQILSLSGLPAYGLVALLAGGEAAFLLGLVIPGEPLCCLAESSSAEAR